MNIDELPKLYGGSLQDVQSEEVEGGTRWRTTEGVCLTRIGNHFYALPLEPRLCEALAIKEKMVAISEEMVLGIPRSPTRKRKKALEAQYDELEQLLKAL